MKIKILALLFLISTSSAHAIDDNACNEEMINLINSLPLKKEKENNNIKGKDLHQEIMVLCTTKNDIISDHIVYSIIPHKNEVEFFVSLSGGFGGINSMFGPFKSDAYNKSLKERLRLDSQSSALPAH